MNLTAALLALIGCSALSLSMKRYFKRVFPQKVYLKKAAILLRTVGSAALATSLAFSIGNHGAGIGIVLFLAILSPAIILTALLMTIFHNKRIGAKKSRAN